MSDRSAEASIKGYNYQFLHTIKDILESDSDDQCTVEGIEDFDIEKDSEKDLIQYKYHEDQSFTNSKVAKPISLMFKYFKDNQQEVINYKLFIYLNDENLPDKTVEKITEILKIKESRKILSVTETEITKEEVDSLSNLINIFVENFSWELTKKYNELEIELAETFQTNFGVTNEESKILYLSNAIKIINDLAIKQDGERGITKRQFVDKLKTYEKIVFSSFIFRTKGFNKLKTLYKKQKASLSIKKNTSNYIVQCNNKKREDLTQLIIELSKKFCYHNNKSDFKPITFIINCSLADYTELKKSIYLYTLSIDENIKINDGFEDYAFNINIFNEKLLSSKNNAGNKFNKLSFNFKLLHQDVFIANFDQMSYSNIGLFILDESESSLSYITEKQFYLNNLTNTQITEIIGE
ncbi:MAG: hypothetical protein ACI9TV_000551 [Sulfurimonas sp.]|jgi:hypothetical protein|uniref:hypothetical protein n=1 Tax=Sulfurimonas sp. TaxID=2022749 RepID=UPI0039E5D2A9